MKILSIHSNGSVEGGADVICIEGNRLLAKQGHDLAWLTIGAVPAAVESNQPVYSLPEFRAAAGFRKSIGLALGHLYCHRARQLAKQAIESFRPDVAHVHTIQGHLSPAVLLPFFEQNIPIVQTLHDYRLLCPAIHFLSHGQVCEACKGGRYYHCIRKRCRHNERLRSAVAALGAYASDRLYCYDRLISAYIAPGEFLRQKMIEYGYPASKIYRLPNAYIRPYINANGSPRQHILFAGRLSYEKGVDLLVRAAARLDVPVMIAGDGPERNSLETLAAEIGAKQARFLGFLPSEVLVRLFQTAIVTVLPSRWYENGPLALLESFANGAPVVGAQIGAIPEFLENGETGYLFRPNDAEDLLRVLQDCIRRPGELSRMGTNAAAQVRTRYSPERYATELEKVLAEHTH